MTFCVPIFVLLFLVLFGAILFPLQAQSNTGKDRGTSTKDHSERIYRDFEMYLKVTLGLTAAFGYIRIEKYSNDPVLAQKALFVIGLVSLLTMAIFSIFILCHQGSKLRRWENIEWSKMIFWQELWAILAMWIFSSGIWLAANLWA